MKKEVEEFLVQSNYIEDERSLVAIEDAKKAWNYGVGFKSQWNVNFVLKIHRLLARRLRPDIAGKLRTCDVWIGGSRKIFVSESLLKDQLKEILKMTEYTGSEFVEEKEAFVKHCHVQFENAHPFEDFNGRTFRLIMNLQRLRLGLPILIIREDEKYSYYAWFKEKDALDRLGRMI